MIAVVRRTIQVSDDNRGWDLLLRYLIFDCKEEEEEEEGKNTNFSVVC